MAATPEPPDRLAELRARRLAEPLRRSDLDPDPVTELQAWWDDAAGAGLYLAEATALATAGAGGRPSVRFVMLRGLDQRGVVFHTNEHSRKGRDLAANPWAAVAMAWHPVGRQARVEGRVERITAAESDGYFASRPRESQVASWASPQSDVVADRSELDRRLAAEEARWAGRPVDRPPHWGGYRIVPAEVELWQGRGGRFHDRFRYTRVAEGWTLERLAP